MTGGKGAEAPSSDRLFAVVLALAGAAVILLMLGRGVWLDEGYTIWFAGHDVSFGRAWTTRWTMDSHPPLFYAVAWLVEPVLGASIRTFRLVNLLALPLVLLTYRLCGDEPDDRRFRRLLAILTAATPFFLLYAAELRSYFWQLLLCACLLAQVRRLERSGLDRALAWTLAATAILVINLHYLGALVPLTVIGLTGLSLAADGRRRDAAFLFAVGFVGTAALGVALWLFVRHSAPTHVNATSPVRSLAIIGLPLLAGFVCNPPATVFAARAARRAFPDRFAVVLGVALVANAATSFAYNLIAHNLVMRYMMESVPLASALVAHLLAAHPPSRRGQAAIWFTAAIVIVGTAAYGLLHRRWETNVPLIARARVSCPSTRVVALSALSFQPPDSTTARSIGTAAAIPLTYRDIAATHRFPVTEVYRGRPEVLVGGPCPTLVWLEHRYIAPGDDAAMVRAAGLRSATGGFVIQRLQDSPERLLLAVRAAP